MDVPAWHPANEDAQLSRQVLANASQSKRTEFKVMAGSTPDTSTDAGRELLGELARGGDGGSAAVEGRGFFDTSDRLYLQEQRRMETEQMNKKRSDEAAELRKFRSTALKVQGQKVAVFVPEVAIARALVAAKTATPPEKTPTVVIKSKKRAATGEPYGTGWPKQPRPSSKAVGGRAVVKNKQNKDALITTTKAKLARASLLPEYSSSDSDSDGNDKGVDGQEEDK